MFEYKLKTIFIGVPGYNNFQKFFLVENRKSIDNYLLGYLVQVRIVGVFLRSGYQRGCLEGGILRFGCLTVCVRQAGKPTGIVLLPYRPHTDEGPDDRHSVA